MHTIALLVGAALAQAVVPAASAKTASPAAPSNESTLVTAIYSADWKKGDYVEVGYSELVRDRAQAAIEVIRSNPNIEADDPTALINLGTAYAMLGRTADAKATYEAALSSDNRYLLELADGSWMDSRRAARVAIRSLARNEVLSLR